MDFVVFERDGRPWLRDDTVAFPITIRADSLKWEVSEAGTTALPSKTAVRESGGVGILRDADGRATALLFHGVRLERRALGPVAGTQLVHRPVRPLDELRREALAATPPVESNRPAAPDLVELVSLDRTIHLDIRYATANNLFGTVFYSQARAFLQRPAARALVRANAELGPFGVALLVHDGYRPWYVTRMFWDAAAPDVRPFVADPASGSKHNRGAAVDLTLYDLRSNKAIVMPSTYDETSVRAAADWIGGTARQRWYRDLLRRAMESNGFSVNPVEWWHFDFHAWQQYPILNTPFERLGRSARASRIHPSTPVAR